jgi:membrane protein DedA with SNARE-associated domain
LGEINSLFAKYGYWAIAFGLLIESAGFPVPGETILLYASFLAYSKHQLYLPYVILIGIFAATIGDNIGYGLGRYGGRPLLERYKRLFHIPAETILKGERLVERYGAPAVFFARFIAGFRIIAGPLTGVLHMSWRRFVVFNFLGATAWVLAVSLGGYFFGKQLEFLMKTFGRLQLLALGAAAIAAVWLYHRWRTMHRARSR